MRDKSYAKVEVGMFDRRGFGPWSDELEVRANLDPDPNFPIARIYLGSSWPDQEGEARDFGAGMLTIQAARELARALLLAADEAAAACPAHVLEVAR